MYLKNISLPLLRTLIIAESWGDISVVTNKGRIHQCAVNTDAECPATLGVSLKLELHLFLGYIVSVSAALCNRFYISQLNWLG